MTSSFNSAVAAGIVLFVVLSLSGCGCGNDNSRPTGNDSWNIAASSGGERKQSSGPWGISNRNDEPANLQEARKWLFDDKLQYKAIPWLENQGEDGIQPLILFLKSDHSRRHIAATMMAMRALKKMPEKSAAVINKELSEIKRQWRMNVRTRSRYTNRIVVQKYDRKISHLNRQNANLSYALKFIHGQQ